MYIESKVNRIKERKKELRWSNQKIAEISGVPLGTINKLFSGATRYPRDKTIDAIANSMGLEDMNRQKMIVGADCVRETGNYFSQNACRTLNVELLSCLPRELRTELIDGHLFYLEEPSVLRCNIIFRMGNIISNYLKKENLEQEVYCFPNLRFPNDYYSLLKMDMCVMGENAGIVDNMYMEGVPGLVIEVTEQADGKHIYERKRMKYESSGVKEYWIIDIGKKRIVMYVFGNDSIPKVHSFQDIVKSYLYPNLEVDFSKIIQ